MSIGAPRRFGAVLMLSAVLGLSAALAQTDEPAAKRTWTDPPARGGTATPAATPAPAPEPVAAPQKPSARAGAPRRSTAQAAPRSSAKPARPRIVERRTVRVAAEPRLSPRPHQTSRLVQVRRAPPPVALRYGYAADPRPIAPGLYDEDERLRRLRQAEAAGFLVVRQRSVEFPDGRRLRTYSPYEPEDEDE